MTIRHRSYAFPGTTFQKENLMSKAVLLTDFGPPGVLKLGDIKIGDPSPTQIRLEG
jgi:hypothetical protein